MKNFRKMKPLTFDTKPDEIDLIVTDNELMKAAWCACHMTDYADPEDRLLITRLTAENGMTIRLILDRHCLKKHIDANQ